MGLLAEFRRLFCVLRIEAKHLCFREVNRIPVPPGLTAYVHFCAGPMDWSWAVALFKETVHGTVLKSGLPREAFASVFKRLPDIDKHICVVYVGDAVILSTDKQVSEGQGTASG